MKKTDDRATRDRPSPSQVRAVLTALLVIILAGIFLTLTRTNPGDPSGTGTSAGRPLDPSHMTRSHERGRAASSSRHIKADPSKTAQEIVAGKVIQFGRSRRELVHAIAKRFNINVSDEVERFFDAVEGGRWEEIDAAHQALLLNQKELNQPRSEELHRIWRPIQETWGAAREAHHWPAQALLDYGNAILGTLRPGTIYAGGTDPGCFIPTLLNETSDGERHMVLTQNALADNTYLQYLDFLYGDRIGTLSEKDSQQAFMAYTADAQRRLEHDRQSPQEPKQLKPGEDVKMVDNRVTVSGQVAVMAINEKLFEMLMTRNPEATFVMEQSFPFDSLYAKASPLGPVMELRVQDQPGGLTAERATESVDYWRTTAQQLLSDPETAQNPSVLKAYAKLISSQAGLFMDQKLNTQAEHALRVATEIYPGNPEVTFRYVDLLMRQNRVADALPIAEGALKAAPGNQQFQDLLNSLKAKQ
jgi:hypothetical protein